MKRIILFVLLASCSINAQANKSIHQSDDQFYPRNTQIIKQTAIPISVHKNNSAHSSNLKKTVFGFLPWWEYAAGSHQNIRFNLLTHIAISFFDADGDGNLIEPPAWPWNDLINNAKTNNVKLIMVVSNFTSDQIHKLLTNQTSKQKLFNNILSKVNAYGFDGVNIDFENLKMGDEGNIINSFMNSLTAFIKTNKPLAEISFDSPVANFSGWDFKGLAEACDYLFIMGYDFYGSWSETTGPSSPLTGNNFSLTKSLTDDYKYVSPEKLILGVPYYGNYWKTNSKNPYTKVAPFDSTKTVNNWVKPSLRYNEIIPQYSSKEKMLDEVSKTPWLRWGQDTMWNQIWYDNENSIGLKYDLAIGKNLKGVGIWALGYDNGRSELWDLIERKFFQPTNVETGINTIPYNFELHQNYPNPFNPETVISYQLPVSGKVSLKVYDVLGREVVTLVDEFMQAGIYNSTFNTQHSTLSSGIYFYTIRAGNFIQTKKMIILK